MSGGIDLRNKKQVLDLLDFYTDEMDAPYFAVYSGKDLKFQTPGDDTDRGKNLLRSTLNMLEKNGTENSFKILFYTERNAAGKLDVSNNVGSATFRLIDRGDGMGVRYGDQAAMGGINGMSRLDKFMLDIDERMKKLEAPAEDNGTIGFIKEIFEYPEVRQRVMGIIDHIVPPKKKADMGTRHQQQITEVTEEQAQQMDKAIQTLLNNGMVPEDLVKLADMSVNDDLTFSIMLGKLRKF